MAGLIQRAGGFLRSRVASVIRWAVPDQSYLDFPDNNPIFPGTMFAVASRTRYRAKYARCGIVRLAVDLCVQAMLEEEWEIGYTDKAEESDALEAKRTLIDALFHRPSEKFPSWEAWAGYVYRKLQIEGETAVQPVLGGPIGIVQLLPLEPELVIFNPWIGSSVAPPKPYAYYTVPGKTKTPLDRWELFWWALGEQANMRGISPMETIWEDIEAYEGLRRALRFDTTLEGRHTAKVINAPNLNVSQVVQMQTELNARYKQSGNKPERKYQVKNYGPDVQLIDLQVDETKAQTPERIKDYERVIIRAWGKQLHQVGYPEDVNRASGIVGLEYATEYDTAMMRSFQSWLTSIVQLMEPTGALCFRFPRLDEEDPKKQAETDSIDLGSGVTTINEARKRRGWNVIDHPDADIPLPLRFGDELMATDPADDDEDPEDDGDEVDIDAEKKQGIEDPF